MSVVSDMGRPTSFTAVGGTVLTDSSITTTTLANRIFEGDVPIMKKLTMLDTRADDAKSGLIYGAVVPRLGEAVNYSIGGDTISLPTPQGGMISVSNMERYNIDGLFGYTGAGASASHVVSPYMGVTGGGFSHGSGRAISVYKGHVGGQNYTAGKRLGIAIGEGSTAASAQLNTYGIGGTVTFKIDYTLPGADTNLRLYGVKQDGSISLLGFSRVYTTATEQTAVVTGASLERLSSAYVACDTSIVIMEVQGTLTQGEANRSDLQCCLSIEGTSSNDVVTFESCCLYVGSAPEASLNTRDTDTLVDLDAVVREYKRAVDVSSGVDALAINSNANDSAYGYRTTGDIRVKSPRPAPQVMVKK
jgi:hypothetical protein